MAAAQLAGEDFLVGLDRLRADEAGQQVTPVPGLAASTATGLARRFTPEHWRGAEAGLARATARMVGMLPAERAAELAQGPVTIDIDATGVEVYGNKKRGVAYTYQGQRAGRRTWRPGPRPRSRWPPTCWPATRSALVGGGAAGAGAGRPAAGRPRRSGGGRAEDQAARRRRVFAGDLARAAARRSDVRIGAKRITTMWKALAGTATTPGAIPSTSRAPRSPSPATARRMAAEHVPADPPVRWTRAGLRRPPFPAPPHLHPDQRALPMPDWRPNPRLRLQLILTNADMSTPAKATACEHWYGTQPWRTSSGQRARAALRHLLRL